MVLVPFFHVTDRVHANESADHADNGGHDGGKMIDYQRCADQGVLRVGQVFGPRGEGGLGNDEQGGQRLAVAYAEGEEKHTDADADPAEGGQVRGLVQRNQGEGLVDLVEQQVQRAETNGGRRGDDQRFAQFGQSEYQQQESGD